MRTERLAALVVALALGSCGPPSAAPAAVEVTRVEEWGASGLNVYYRLRDAAGAPTTSDGTLTISVRDRAEGEGGPGSIVCSADHSVSRTSWDRMASEREWSTIAQSHLAPPCPPPAEGHVREIAVSFRASGSTALLPEAVAAMPPVGHLWVAPPLPPEPPPPPPDLSSLRAWASTVAAAATTFPPGAAPRAPCPPSSQATAPLVDEEDVITLRVVVDGERSVQVLQRDRRTAPSVVRAIDVLEGGTTTGGEVDALVRSLEAAGPLLWVRRTTTRREGRVIPTTGLAPEFEPGEYHGLLYLLDRGAGTVLCATAVEATSAERVRLVMPGDGHNEVEADLDLHVRGALEDARRDLVGQHVLRFEAAAE